MAKFSITELKNITDNLGKCYQKTKELVGTPDTSDTLKYAAQLNLERILSTNDDERIVYIHDAIKFLRDDLNPEGMLINFYRSVITALHTNLNQSVSDFWDKKRKENDPDYVRICPEYALLSAACGYPLNPRLVFPPKTSLGRYQQGVGFIKLDTVNRELFGGGKLQIVIEVGNWDMGQTFEVKVEGYDEEGNIKAWNATFTDKSPGDTIDLLPQEIFCVEVINITITSGTPPTNGQFRVETKLDRIITF